MLNKNIRTLILYLCILCFTSNGQITADSNRFELSYLDKNSYYLSSIKLFLTGEFHYQPGNFNIMLSYWDFLNKNQIYPKYIIEEQGPSYAYLFNKYLETGDNYLLDLMEGYEGSKKLYKQIRFYRNNLPSDKKFYSVGVDIEQYSYMTMYALRDILMRSFSNIKDIDTLPDELWSLHQEVKTMDRPDLWRRKDLKKTISKISKAIKTKDSIIIKSWSGNDFQQVQNIIKSFDLSLKRKRLFLNNEGKKFQKAREELMTKNIYDIYLKDSSAISYGHFGLNHIQLSLKGKYNSLAVILNSDRKYNVLNNKICSNTIYYSYFKKKDYKSLNLDYIKINEKLRTMENNTLYLFSLEDKPKYSNLLLFKKTENK